MMTEDEARKKWCPMARCVDSINEQAGVNRRNGMEDLHFPDPKCIASDCMMWRSLWTQEQIDWVKDQNENTPAEQEKYPEPPDAPCGFCGLAGKP